MKREKKNLFVLVATLLCIFLFTSMVYAERLITIDEVYARTDPNYEEWSIVTLVEEGREFEGYKYNSDFYISSATGYYYSSLCVQSNNNNILGYDTFGDPIYYGERRLNETVYDSNGNEIGLFNTWGEYKVWDRPIEETYQELWEGIGLDLVAVLPQTIISYMLNGSNTNSMVTFEEGLNFTETAGAHMNEAGRYVPVQTLQEAISLGNSMPDPRGSLDDAMMYYSTMWKNGQQYNLEVLYDEFQNLVYHFRYTRSAIGNLPAIK